MNEETLDRMKAEWVFLTETLGWRNGDENESHHPEKDDRNDSLLGENFF